MTGIIFDIKEMAVHDGPGIRTTVFFKGCPLRCRWCHNPEGLSAAPQLMFRENRCHHCGRCYQPCTHAECQPFHRCIHACPEGLLSISGQTIDAKDLAKRLRESEEEYGPGFGGFTFSGGEPLLQWQFLLEVMDEMPGANFCIETSGYAQPEVYKQVIDRLDTVIMDLKIADPLLHQKYTGVSNEQILQNFAYLKQSGKPFIIRTPLIPGIVDTPANLEALEKLIGEETKTVDGNAPEQSFSAQSGFLRWEKLPYNAMAGAKYKMLGMEYPMEKCEM